MTDREDRASGTESTDGVAVDHSDRAPGGAEPSSEARGTTQGSHATGDDGGHSDGGFVWGQTREPEESSDDGSAGSDERPSAEGRAPEDGPDGEVTEERLERMEAALERLAETAEDLSVLAMNAELKLARGEVEAVREVAYDLQADARRTSRETQKLAVDLAALREDVEEAGGGPTRGTPDEGSKVVAGVDLSRWPGDLGPFDYQRARAAVRRSAGADPGDVPPSTRRFELADGEVSFARLLAMAVGSDGDSGRQPPGDGERV